MPSEAKERSIVRHLLTAIDDDAGVSQRKLSNEMGIAVGSVNWHLKRCVSKGLIKLQQTPVKRYLYYLTPKGFEEKARLTAAFIQTSFDLYRRGRGECIEFFEKLSKAGSSKVVFAGDSDFVEIAIVSAIETETDAIAIVDGKSIRVSRAGVPVVATLTDAVERLPGERLDAVLVTDLIDPRGAYESAAAQAVSMAIPREIIHVPRILNFRPIDVD